MANVTHEQLAEVVLGIAKSQAAIIRALRAPAADLHQINMEITRNINILLNDADRSGNYSLSDLPIHALRDCVNGLKPEFSEWLMEEIEKHTH